MESSYPDSVQTTEERRATRSLRVLHHQRDKILSLENVFRIDLQKTILSLSDLEDVHGHLLEAHVQQSKLNDLQIRLINLQNMEIASKTHVTSVNNEEFAGKPQYLLHVSDSDSPVENTFEKSYSARSRSERVMKMNDCDESVNDNAISVDVGRLEKLLKTKEQRLAKLSNEILPNSGGCVRREQETWSDDDEDDVKIAILENTLSAHQSSIQSLTEEVVHLKNEKTELMQLVENLLEVKSSELEETNSYTDPGTSKTGTFKPKKSSRDARFWNTTCRYFTPAQAHFLISGSPPEQCYNNDDSAVINIEVPDLNGNYIKNRRIISN